MIEQHEIEGSELVSRILKANNPQEAIDLVFSWPTPDGVDYGHYNRIRLCLLMGIFPHMSQEAREITTTCANGLVDMLNKAKKKRQAGN